MNAAIGYNDANFIRNDFNDAFAPVCEFIDMRRLNRAIALERDFRTVIFENLRKLGTFAFMVRLAAKEKAPVTREEIEAIRDVYMVLENRILKNPLIETLDEETRRMLEEMSMHLAIGGSILAIDSDPDIKAHFGKNDDKN